MKRALITGITGQDGSYLAEFLIAKGYEVHGLIRRSSSFNTSRIEHLYADPHEKERKLILHYGDLTDGIAISNLVREVMPHEIYNLAAQSHVMVSFSVPIYTANVDAVGTIALLEAIRMTDPSIKFYQASTSELFGSTPPPQSESSKFQPRSPYAAAKLYSYWVTNNYKEGYGLFAVNGILFNHESPRRGETFVTRKISKAVAKIVEGKQESLYLGNLEAVRDWGYAKEYVEAMWMMLQNDSPESYVVATGIAASVKDFCAAAFETVGLDWTKYVITDDAYLRPLEVESLIGDPTRIEGELGWKHKTEWRGLAKLMVEADLSNSIEKNN